MRLNLTLTPNAEPVPFNHLHRLTGTLHKWLGPDNDQHDGPSLYSFGWLKGGRADDGALQFPEGASWRISFHNPTAAKQALKGLLDAPMVLAGMRVAEVQQQTVPDLDGKERFEVDAPVIARRRREDGSREYLLHDDPKAGKALTRTLRAKLEAAGAGADLDTVRVRFDPSYSRAHTKLAAIEKGADTIKHKGSICPVIVEGGPEVTRFAWNVGVGELTGSGFGALK
jgi:CRISPR-associated endoribonuclease Cas6